MGKPRSPSSRSPTPKSVVISARVSFRVCALIDEAAHILSTKRRRVERQQVLVEGAKRLAGAIVRGAGRPDVVRGFRALLKALAAVDGR